MVITPLTPTLNPHHLHQTESPPIQYPTNRNPSLQLHSKMAPSKKEQQCYRSPPMQPQCLTHNQMTCSLSMTITIIKKSPLHELRIMANNGHKTIHLKYLHRHAERNQVNQQLQESTLNGFPSHSSQLPQLGVSIVGSLFSYSCYAALLMNCPYYAPEIV